MQVIHVITSLDMGGAERVAINIAKSTNSQFTYHVVEVVKSHSTFSNAIKKELADAGVSYHCSPVANRKMAICLFWTWFTGLYLRVKPAVVHVHTEIPDLAVWLFRKVAWLFKPWINPRYVRTLHNTVLWSSWGAIGRIVERYYMRHHCNVAVSKGVGEAYAARFGEKDVPVVYNGIEPKEQKSFLGRHAASINILFAGRLEHQKGVEVLIEVVKAFADDPRFFFTIVGEGSMGGVLKEQTDGLINVELHDKVYDLSSYIGAFDYMFMPSNHEGLPLISVEAALAHTPVIANRCAGLVETLPDDWPLAVEGNSVEAFVALLRNLPDADEHRRLGDIAYGFAIERFSMEHMRNEYEKIYLGKGN